MKRGLVVFFLFTHLWGYPQKNDFKYISFKNADSIANLYRGTHLKNMPVLAYNLTCNLESQVEKFRAIYVWVCSNIKSNHSFGELVLRKRKRYENDSLTFYQWNNEVQSLVYKTLLNEQKTICTGYAYLIKELATLADIDCEIIDGYCRTTKRNVGKVDIPNHSWNAVKLNNKWYLVDATLASGYYDVDKKRFVENYNDGYFLADPELYITKYYPLIENWTLRKEKTSLEEFVNAPMTYGNTFKYAIIPILPKSLNTRIWVGEKLNFEYKIVNNYMVDDLRLIISSGLRSKSITVTDLDYTNDLIQLKNRFNKKGNYNIHFMVNSDIVVSYSVRVDKPKKYDNIVLK